MSNNRAKFETSSSFRSNVTVGTYRRTDQSYKPKGWAKKQLDDKLKLFEKVNWLTSAERFEFYSLSFMHRTLIQKSNLSNIMSEFYIKIPESERS
jgi:hypothetical protein